MAGPHNLVSKLWLCAPLLILCLGVLAAGADPTVHHLDWMEDAELKDIFFVNVQRGWAVGDRGVIWHTNDGGRYWQLQTAPVQCRLECVFFWDANHGWIVGGQVHPYTHMSTGIVLWTADGGRSWKRISDSTISGLKRIKMLDRRHGWALGHSSRLFPAGVYWTEDGARSWSAVPTAATGRWLAGDFRDRDGGAVAGRNGTLANVQVGGLRPSRTPNAGWRHLRDLKLTGATGGWLVGDGGLVMKTVDGGISWQTPSAPLPDDVDRQFDFASVAVAGSHCWIGGSPGTCVFHSPDAGKSWNVYRTGQNIPIHRLFFTDERHGWSAGSLGNILATQDGGQTWKVQRSGGTRAALLGIYSEPSDIPLELFAQLSLGEGYLGVIELINRRDMEIRETSDVDLAERAHRATIMAGASGAQRCWRFPLRQNGLRLPADQVVQNWDRANDGQGVVLLEKHIVSKIRQWRPDLVVTHTASPQGKDPVAHLVNQVVLSAVDKAADATSYPKLSASAGLGPWKVTKVFSTLEPEQSGAITVTSAKLIPAIGHSLAEQTAQARGMLERQYRAGPASRGFRLLTSRLPRELSIRDFFSGIALQPGGDARRRATLNLASGWSKLRERAQKRRNVEKLLERADRDAASGAGWVGQVADLTRDLDQSNAGQIVYHLAQRYRQSGQPELAAETFGMLTDRYPDHELTPAAQRWLVQYLASGEAAWRQRGGTRFAARQVRFDAAVQPNQSILGHQAVDEPAEHRAVLSSTGSSGTASAAAKLMDRAAQAIALAKHIEGAEPALYAEPELRFPLAVAHRRQGLPREAEGYYNQLTVSGVRDEWTDSARMEQWLKHARGLPPKPLLKCRLAAHSRPRLDGRLDDQIWKSAKSISLSSAQHDDADWAAVALLAVDREYLYLAVSCRNASSLADLDSDEPRPHDADLSAQDRVDFLIDVDRDYVSYYRLTVDHRGWTGEACLGDNSWNPEWFVAAAREDGAWKCEAAIPIHELVGHAPQTGDAWAMGIQRTVPGVGFQSWTQPAAVEVIPEGFGILVLE